MRNLFAIALITISLAACGNPTEKRIEAACRATIYDQPDKMTVGVSQDRTDTWCECFATNTRDNEGSTYLQRLEYGLTLIATRRQQDDVLWTDALVSILVDLERVDNTYDASALEDVVSRVKHTQDILSSGGKCSDMY